MRELLQLAGDTAVGPLEIEFKEVPYFLVSRAASKWSPEQQGDLNEIEILGVGEKGLIVDPDSTGGKTRRTLVPWSNIVSLSLTSAPSSAGGKNEA